MNTALARFGANGRWRQSGPIADAQTLQGGSIGTTDTSSCREASKDWDVGWEPLMLEFPAQLAGGQE